jgi:hypothetical protein
MDDLSAIAYSAADSGPAVWVGKFAEDAATANAEIEVLITDIDPGVRFGPVKFAPQPRSDGNGVLLPTRGDWCLVAFDQDDNAQLISWRTDDPTA